MKLSTPRWWYSRDRRVMPMTRGLLTPLSWVWAGVTARRIARAQPTHPDVEVVCVGNVTMGGSGKTPVVLAIAHRLAKRGLVVHLLSRGYGGRLAGPMLVDPNVHTESDVGDEPLMLAQYFPVWISRDRFAGARAAAAAGAEVVVMDDGHQNRTVGKYCSLIVVDGETRHGEWPFGDGRVFPAGPMREPLEAGLARADGSVILLPVGVNEPDPELLEVLATRPVFVARLRASAPPSGPLVGFAGIAKPWKFEQALKAAGAELADFAPFPDHASYSEATLKFLQQRATQFDARLITTEKDWVRLPLEWRGRVTAWRVQAEFEDDRIDGLLPDTPFSP